MLDRTFAFMGNATRHLEQGTAPATPVLHLLFPGDPRSVRQALKTALAVFARLDLGGELDGVVEIVLAEVLNNVVEHAYEDRGHGRVELDVTRTPEAPDFRVRDDGRPMPGGDVPEGTARDLDVATEDLPEGGFGWFLIHSLTEDLRYRRCGDRNELTFKVRLDARAPAR